MVSIQTNIVPRLFELRYHLGYGLICFSHELLIFVIVFLFYMFSTNLYIFQSSFFFSKTLFFTTKNFCLKKFFFTKNKLGKKLLLRKIEKFISPNCFWFFILTKSWFDEYNVIFTKNFFETVRPFPAITKGVKWKLPF